MRWRRLEYTMLPISFLIVRKMRRLKELHRNVTDVSAFATLFAEVEVVDLFACEY